MKKFLLSILFFAAIGIINQSRAQCSGAAVTITNFTVVPNGNQVNYGFNWEYVQGNASIEVVFLCNGVEIGSLPCIPRLKDSAAGPHNVSGSFNTSCAGSFRVEIRIWSNPTCGGTYCIEFREIALIPTPVQFKSFNALRSRANVGLKWETAWEQNSAGFIIERNTKGAWEQVGYVPTQATGGNSTDLLVYQFTDPNNSKGISQYRIKQVDLDAKAKYSDIRTVRGENQVGTIIVYPNPSPDGKVNVSFEDAATRDIVVVDMSGRVVKQLKGVTTNSITIENLVAGIYNLRVTDPATGEQAVSKIIVNKR